MAQYLVTGGCGFIGSHLCEALVNAGHRVRVLDNLSTGKVENLNITCEVLLGDVGEIHDVKKSMEGVDGCFHLAAVASVERSIEDWPGTHRTNLSGAIHVFDCAKENEVPVVYASSAAVYGDNASMPLNENVQPCPLSAYGADKLGCEYHAKVAGLIHHLPTVGLRFFNVFGPRQDPKSPYSGVISIFVDRMINHKPLKIFGDGQQVRDFVYVKDVVRFLRRAMQNVSCEGDVYNVCTGQTTSILQLAKILSAITGEALSIDQMPSRGGDIQVSIGDVDKALRHLRICAKTSLAEGLKETIGYLLTESRHAAQ